MVRSRAKAKVAKEQHTEEVLCQAKWRRASVNAFLLRFLRPFATFAFSVQSAENVLTPEEKAAGWRLVFNGKDFTGWHNFKSEAVKPGWQIKDGTMAVVDPKNASDLVTADKFTWFELQLDYNISTGGNSGIMFHVTEEGRAPWATGPEFQLEDNAAASDPIRCGWLYQLYQPPNDHFRPGAGAVAVLATHSDGVACPRPTACTPGGFAAASRSPERGLKRFRQARF